MATTPTPTPAAPQTPQAPPSDLAGKVRAKYPGTYDDLDDATLTKKILAKYPQYGDLAAPSSAPAPKPTTPPQPGLPAALKRAENLNSIPATIGPAQPPTIMQRVKSAFRRPSQEDKEAGLLPGETTSLMDPTRAMSPSEQEAHPYLTGAARGVAGLAEPENLAIIPPSILLGGIPEIGPAIAKALTAGFAASMAAGAGQHGERAVREWVKGNYPEAKSQAVEAATNAIMAGMAARHAGSTVEARATAPEAARSEAAPSRLPPQLNAAPKPPIITPEPKPESLPSNPRAEIVGKDAQGKPIYGQGPAKIVGYRADGKTPIYEGYENVVETKTTKKGAKPPVINKTPGNAVENNVAEKTPQATNTPAAAPNNQAEVNDLRVQMKTLEQKINRASWTKQRPMVEKYNALEARLNKLVLPKEVQPEAKTQPQQAANTPTENASPTFVDRLKQVQDKIAPPEEREVMRQPQKTSIAAPTGEAVAPPPELKADLEKQAGRPLTDAEANTMDRANLERGMAETPPPKADSIAERRDVMAKPPVLNTDFLSKIPKPQEPIRYKDLSPELRAEVDESVKHYTGTDYWNQEFTRQATGMQRWKDLPIKDRFANLIQSTRAAVQPVIEELKPTLDKLAQHEDPEISNFAKQIQSGTFATPDNVQAFRKMIEEKGAEADAQSEFDKAVDALAAGPEEPGGREPGEDAAPEAGRVAEPVPPGNAATPEARGEERSPSEKVNLEKEAWGKGYDAAEAGTKRGENPYPPNTMESNAWDAGHQDANTPTGPGVLPGMGEAVKEQAAAAETEKTKRAIEERQAEPKNIDAAAGELETKSPLFRDTEASPQNEMFSEKTPKPSDPETMQGIGTKLTAGIDPTMVRTILKRLDTAYQKHIADPIIEKVLHTGRTHEAVEKIDEGLASRLRLHENGRVALKAQAEANTAKVINGLDRGQERLFVLMADKMSRENLQKNHPEEYAQALGDPAIMKSLERYAKLDRQLTAARAALGGQNLEGEHLRWNYPEHVSGVGKKNAATEGMPSATLKEVITPQRVDKKGRTTTPEYHYENGLHEFGPAYSKMYVSTMSKLQEHMVASRFISSATRLEEGDALPPTMTYRGETYYRPDVVQMIKEAKPGAESKALAEELGVEELPTPKKAESYAVYDPKGGKTAPGEEVRFLGPTPVVDALNGMDKQSMGEGGPVQRFIREQIIGLGFGVPHVFNIMRRITQGYPGGAANPFAWVKAGETLFSKELKDRAISGAADPQMAALMKWGGVSPHGVSSFREYWGGNYNPANWMRVFAKVGHDYLFNAGGIDQRARLMAADLIKSQRPDLGDERISQLVNDQIGRYNRATWTDPMKRVSRYMIFPGWDFSSINWVLRHPIRSTVPPAVIVMLANQALNQAGLNQPEDKWDPFNVHVGRRAYGTRLITEPLGTRLAKPLIRTASGLMSGEAPRRAIAEGASAIPGAAAAPLSMAFPTVSLPIEMATNKKVGGGDIVERGDFDRPGAVLPNKGIEDEIEHAAGTLLPQAGRVASTLADTPEKQDVAGALASNLGITTSRQDPLVRLQHHASLANSAVQTIREAKEKHPDQLRDLLASDPDIVFYAREHGAIEEILAAGRKLDAAEARAETTEQRDQIKARREQLANAAEEFNRRFEEAKIRHRETSQTK